MKKKTKVVAYHFNYGSTTFAKIPRKLKKALKKIEFDLTIWKSKECKIKEYTTNFRGKSGVHRVTSYSLGY